jgi:hypothetical protein
MTGIRTMDETESARAIGSLEARADGVDGRLKVMASQVNEIHDIVLQSKGGFRFMLALSSICAAAGGLIGTILTMMRFGR